MIWVCDKCGKHWYYPMDKCIYCRQPTKKLEPTKFTVKGSSKVYLTSAEHSAAPYYSLLLEDEYGFLHTQKTYEKHELGDVITKEKTKECGPKKVIGIVGAGILGKDIAKVMLQSGFKVILKARNKDTIKNTEEKISEYLLKNFGLEEKGKIFKNLVLTTDNKKLEDADFVLECVVEKLEVKKQVFKELEKTCGKKTIFATNTSSLSINKLAKDLSEPKRLVGMHFFNPATKMRLVEVVKGAKTDQRVVEETADLVKKINKIPVIVKDSPAFIANRILMPYLNESILLLEEGAAKKEDIDETAKLALNHPMGPFQLLDLIGLDVFVEIMNNLYRATGNPKYKPSKLAEKMVAEGKIGRKNGEGFYKYKK